MIYKNCTSVNGKLILVSHTLSRELHALKPVSISFLVVVQTKWGTSCKLWQELLTGLNSGLLSSSRKWRRMLRSKSNIKINEQEVRVFLQFRTYTFALLYIIYMFNNTRECILCGFSIRGALKKQTVVLWKSHVSGRYDEKVFNSYMVGQKNEILWRSSRFNRVIY